MRKCLALLFAIIMILSISAAHAEQHEAIQSGDWEYRIQDDGSVIITRYTSKREEANIPSSLDGMNHRLVHPGRFFHIKK